MPDLLGLTEDEARQELGDIGIDDGDIQVVERESLDEAGTIVEQVPSSGQRISGSVNLIVAKPVGLVPDFAGQQISDVEDWAEERAIEVRVEEVLDDTLADGEVVATTPAADEEATSEILVQVARTPVIGQLSDMDYVDDDCYDGLQSGEASISGDSYPNSVWTASTGCGFEFDLGEDWSRFKAIAGLTDDSDSGIQLRFEVFADGTSIFNEVLGLGQTAEVDVDVEGVLRLRIAVAEVGDGDGGADAAWGNARLVGSPAQVEDGTSGSTTTEP